MSGPTPEQIAKLPKWAQDHIFSLARQRDVAVRSLTEWADSQTERPFRIQEYACIADGSPTGVVRYIEGNRITAVWGGMEVGIVLNSTARAIQVYFDNARDFHCLDAHVVVSPRASNLLELRRMAEPQPPPKSGAERRAELSTPPNAQETTTT